MRFRRLAAAATLLLIVPGLALAASAKETGVGYAVRDVRALPAGGATSGHAPEGVVAGHTAYAVIELGSVAPNTVTVVGHAECHRKVAGFRVGIPALSGGGASCPPEVTAWALGAGVTPPADAAELAPTGWSVDVPLPGGGVARTVEYAFPAWRALPDGSLVQDEDVLWETTIRPLELAADGAPYNFAFGLNADALADRGIERLNVVLRG